MDHCVDQEMRLVRRFPAFSDSGRGVARWSSFGFSTSGAISGGLIIAVLSVFLLVSPFAHAQSGWSFAQQWDWNPSFTLFPTPHALCEQDLADDRVYWPDAVLVSVVASTQWGKPVYLCYVDKKSGYGALNDANGYPINGGNCPDGSFPDKSGNCPQPKKPPCSTTKGQFLPDDGYGNLCPIGGGPGGNRGNGCAVADPVDIATGNNFHEVKLASFGPLSLSMDYNSSAGSWTNELQWAFLSDNDSADVRWLHQGDGKLVKFTKDSDGNFVADNPAYGKVITLRQGFRYATASQIISFDSYGRLMEMQWRNAAAYVIRMGDQLKVIRHSKTLATITLNSTGQLSTVAYGSHTISLIYDANHLLASITRDGTKSQTFLYEDSNRPYLLTGIDNANGTPYARWTYDAQGRVIEASNAGGADDTKLQFNSDSSVSVINPLGKQSTYQFADIDGVKKLASVAGQPSQNCAAAHKNTSYYSNGLVKTQTDWKGNVTAYTYNSRGLETGRIEAEGTPQERTITTQWDPRFPLPTQVTKPNQVITMTYDAQGHLLTRTVSPR